MLLNYNPRAIILSTLDPDHLDYFKNFEDYKNLFAAFRRNCRATDIFGNLG